MKKNLLLIALIVLGFIAKSQDIDKGVALNMVAKNATLFLYFFFFLLKSLLQKKDKNQRKKAGKHLLTFIINQLVFNLLFF